MVLEKAVRIYLYNYGRSKNWGDVAISAVLERIAASLGWSVLVNETHYAKGLLHWLTSHIASFLDDIGKIYRSNALFIGGGNLIMDTADVGVQWALHHAWLSFWSLIFRKPYFYICVGVSPLTKPLSQWCYRFAVKHATAVSVRDRVSAEYLIQLTGRTDIQILPDPAVFASDVHAVSKVENTHQQQIGICPVVLYPRIFPDPEIYQKYLDIHAALIEVLLQRGFAVNLLLNDDHYDMPAAQAILERLGDQAQAVPVKSGFQDMFAHWDFIASLDFVISARLHAAIIAMSYGIPTIGLGWQPKVQAFFDDRNLPGGIDLLSFLTNTTVNQAVDFMMVLFDQVAGQKKIVLPDTISALQGFMINSERIS